VTIELTIPAYNFDAAVIPSYRPFEDAPHGARQVALHTATMVYPALTWLHLNILQQNNPDHVIHGNVDACEVKTSNSTQMLILTKITARPDNYTNAMPYLHTHASPISGEVNSVRKLIATISNCAIRRFVNEAFTYRDAFEYFWTCPASLNHHHAHPGGLAEHSRDVAERAAHAMFDEPMQRDFAIAYGLLHDFGKIWSYEDGALTEMARRLGHEQIGYEKLLPAILRLRQCEPDCGIVLQSLLSGEWKRDGKRPIQAVGNLIRTLDQMSTDSDLKKRNHGKAGWKPVIVSSNEFY